MPILTAQTVQCGDQRKAAAYVVPSDAKPGLTLTSATYTAKLHSSGVALAVNGSGPATVTTDSAGILVATPILTMPATADTVVVDFVLTWSDGQIDGTLSINMPCALANT